jgi:hypothetical protein
MRIRSVDPRDVGWGEDSPNYRVTFWERQSPLPPGIPPEAMGYTSYEYEISDAVDVFQVIAWAEAEAGDHTYTLYATVSSHNDPHGEPGLLHLAGIDPTEAPPRAVERPVRP